MSLKEKNDLSGVPFIRSIHKEIPRKLMVTAILDTIIKEEEDKAYCTVELKKAPMISLDELKAYAVQNGERTSVKKLIGWLEGLK
ncbi:hypothetical protein D3C71_1688980 [compost metagenome]